MAGAAVLRLMPVLHQPTLLSCLQYRTFQSGQFNTKKLLRCQKTRHFNRAKYNFTTGNMKYVFSKRRATRLKIGGLISSLSLGAVFHVNTNQDKDYNGPPNNQDQDNELLFACKGPSLDGESKNVGSLLENGANPSVKHDLGWSALHVAAINKQPAIVKKLLEWGADPNCLEEFSTFEKVSQEKNKSPMYCAMIRDKEFSHQISKRADFQDCTPLHYAVIIGDVLSVNYLLKAGADPTRENVQGHMPAVYSRNKEITQILEASAKQFLEAREAKDAEERRKFPLELRLQEDIIGQQGAINIVSAAVRRKQNGWYDEDHPLVLLFLGSSGIGKTETAKQVSKYIHKAKKEGFIRVDMSEYQEKHDVAKFIGAPPGYVGHDDGGQLTKALTKCHNAVVLFDEVDKAHPDCLTIMLQLFDEGRLTDGKGTTIDCKDAMFIMTSNLASEEIAGHAIDLRKEAASQAAMKGADKIEDLDGTEKVMISRKFKDQVVRPILKWKFRRDEFLGRINEIVYFLPFSQSELSKLVTKELQFWAERAQRKHNIELMWDHQVVDVLAGGFDTHYGARSIKHEVERRVVGQLAMAHEKQLISPGCRVKVIVHNPDDLVQDEGADDTERVGPTIKLQLLEAGTTDTYKDIGITGPNITDFIQ